MGYNATCIRYNTTRIRKNLWLLGGIPFYLFCNPFFFTPVVKDVNVLLERQRSDGVSSPSRDDDSTLQNAGTHSSILDDNTKSDSGVPEVSGSAKSKGIALFLHS